MMGPGEVFALLIVVQTLIDRNAPPQTATNNAYLEERVRVLEQIVTDSGAQTAAQIEALRERPRLRTEHPTEGSN